MSKLAYTETHEIQATSDLTVVVKDTAWRPDGSKVDYAFLTVRSGMGGEIDVDFDEVDALVEALLSAKKEHEDK